MKKSVASIVFSLCCVFTASAGLNDWHWIETEYHYDSSAPNGALKVQMDYRISGDTVCAGVTYNKLYRKCIGQDSTTLHPNGLYGSETVVRACLREDASGRIYLFEGIGTPERLLYNFSNWSAGDTLYYSSVGYSVIKPESLDSILLSDGTRTQLYDAFNLWTEHFGSNGESLGMSPLTLISGIGYTNGFLYGMVERGSLMGKTVVSFYKNDKLVWKQSNPMGLSDITSDNGINTYTHEHSLVIETPGNLTRLTLHTFGGKLVLTQPIQGIDIVKTAPLAKGAYILTLYGTGGRATATKKVFVP